ncbi:uncharacterized protein F5147DRAFT_662426 [Suillus discolor]|uniref:Secreted protein n=1 Tax=Suillus discolor TaxID=1912936 RepID=A0A9P7FKQ7_9AGAM|nr:uncharacterized protein F5147DRAFT_662426 [Suillus discolor]KAG2120565.1 hypothetical protein F5147DRAFT_662426 [Suillus discolor]
MTFQIYSIASSSHTMRFSFAIVRVFALVTAFASSISAMPTDASIGYCPMFCHKQSECSTCIYNHCVSFSSLCLGFKRTTHRHGRASLYARVERDVIRTY